MTTLRALGTAWFAAATALACGPVPPSSSPECTGVATLQARCGLWLGGLTAQNCGEYLYFQSAACRGALKRYLGCALPQTCRALSDPNSCGNQEQMLAVTCAGGNATVTTNPNGTLRTVPRTQLVPET